MNQFEPIVLSDEEKERIQNAIEVRALCTAYDIPEELLRGKTCYETGLQRSLEMRKIFERRIDRMLLER